MGVLQCARQRPLSNLRVPSMRTDGPRPARSADDTQRPSDPAPHVGPDSRRKEPRDSESSKREESGFASTLPSWGRPRSRSGIRRPPHRAFLGVACGGCARTAARTRWRALAVARSPDRLHAVGTQCDRCADRRRRTVLVCSYTRRQVRALKQSACRTSFSENPRPRGPAG